MSPKVFPTPMVNGTVRHQLGTQEGMTRIRGAVAEAMGGYGDRVGDVKERWEGGRRELSGRVRGFRIFGSIDARPGAVEIRGDLPPAAAMFKGQVEALLSKRAKNLPA